MRLILALILLSATPAFAQLAEPQLQTCPRATEGTSTVPWVQCEGGIRFAPINPDLMVATGDFQQGTWRKFSDLPGETMVAICPRGAILETETRCRTADGSTWATRFARVDSLAFRVTYRWEPVTLWDDQTPITEPVTYILTWCTAEDCSVSGVQANQITTAGPPLVLNVPRQRICASVRAKVGDVESDKSTTVCIAPPRKPGIPANVTVEFGVP